MLEERNVIVCNGVTGRKGGKGKKKEVTSKSRALIVTGKTGRVCL